jgi:multiple sugar transport system substrate-binding protein
LSNTKEKRNTAGKYKASLHARVTQRDSKLIENELASSEIRRHTENLNSERIQRSTSRRKNGMSKSKAITRTQTIIAVAVIVIIIGAGVGYYYWTLPKAPLELKVLTNLWETTKRWMELAIPEYENETGIKISVTTADYAASRKKIFLDLPVGAYDIYILDSVYLSPAVETGYLVDLTSYVQTDSEEIDLDDFPEKVQDHIMMWEGKYYTLPIEWIMYHQVWRGDLLDKYGLTMPDTWDEFLDNVEALHLKEEGTSGVAVWGQRGHGAVTQWASIWYAMGGQWFTQWPEEPWDLTPTINTTSGLDALNFLIDIANYSTPGYLTFGWTDMGMSMALEKAASLCTWTSGYGTWEDPSVSKVYGNVTYGMMPRTLGLPRKIGMGGWGFAINNQSAHIDEAWDFIKFSTSKEIMKEMALFGPDETPYAVATRSSIWADSEVKAHYSDGFADAILNSIPHLESEFRPRVPEWPEIEEAVGLRINQALSGELTPKEALDLAQADVVDILEAAGKL